MAKEKENAGPSAAGLSASSTTDRAQDIILQGWIGLAIWMSAGLLFEGLIGFRVPLYLADEVRREMFRLGHAHGTLLNIILLLYGLCIRSGAVDLGAAASVCLRAGSILMPLGFVLGGAFHYESDPGALVFLAPLGGLLVIFGVVNAAMSVKRDKK